MPKNVYLTGWQQTKILQFSVPTLQHWCDWLWVQHWNQAKPQGHGKWYEQVKILKFDNHINLIKYYSIQENINTNNFAPPKKTEWVEPELPRSRTSRMALQFTLITLYTFFRSWYVDTAIMFYKGTKMDVRQKHSKYTVLGDSGGVVNSLHFCLASLKSLGCFYFRCVLSSQWKAVTVNLRILHCQL